jgi:hypothetical protein
MKETIRAVNMDNKQTVVELLLLVESGWISTSFAANILQQAACVKAIAHLNKVQSAIMQPSRKLEIAVD